MNYGKRRTKTQRHRPRQVFTRSAESRRARTTRRLGSAGASASASASGAATWQFGRTLPSESRERLSLVQLQPSMAQYQPHAARGKRKSQPGATISSQSLSLLLLRSFACHAATASFGHFSANATSPACRIKAQLLTFSADPTRLAFELQPVASRRLDPFVFPYPNSLSSWPTGALTPLSLKTPAS